jgi:hypothetical protein
VEPKHGVWESNAINYSRKKCRAGVGCRQAR